jgi:hypothetical protein
MSIYLDPSSTATTMSVAVYADASGKPGALLDSGRTTSPHAGQWNTVRLRSSLRVTAGTTYWLAVFSPQEGLRYLDRRDGTCTTYASGSNMTSVPSVWGASNYTGHECPASLYLRGTAG